MSKNRAIIFLQDDKTTAFPIIDHLLETQSDLLKDEVELIIVEGDKEIPWKEEYGRLRKRLRNLGVQFELEDAPPAMTPITAEYPTFIFPLYEKAAIDVSAAWTLHYGGLLNNPSEYWKPVNSLVRVLSSYIPGTNAVIRSLFEEENPIYETLKSVSNLIVASRYIDCHKINSLGKTVLLKDKAKDLIKKLKDSLHPNLIALRSYDPNFQVKFYVNQEVLAAYENNASYRLIDSLVPDIKLYSEYHPEGHLFLQPIFTGKEIVSNVYVSDSGKVYCSNFYYEKQLDGQIYLQPAYEFRLNKILERISEIGHFKNFSAKFIKVGNDYALIGLKHSFNNQLPVTLKYQSDFITYEITRGLWDHPTREKLLIGEFYETYTDKKFKGNLIY